MKDELKRSGSSACTGDSDRSSAPWLRRLRATDAADVLEAFLSDDDMNRQGDVASLSDAEQYVGRLTGTSSNHDAWAIMVADRLIGLIGTTVDEENRSGWFWYWMGRHGRGRGWTKRSAATVANWALRVRGLERLELGHRANNPASGGIARAAGFVPEGTERAKFLIDGERIDVHTYGRLRTDPWPDVAELPMIDDPTPDEPRISAA